MKRLPFSLRRLKPPRRLRVTSEGKWFLLVTVGVGAAAINTGNNMLYLALSMNLSLIILSGVLSERCVRGVSVRVRHAAEAFASRDSLLAVTCSAGGKRFPALSLSCALSIDGVPCIVRFPEVPAGGAVTRIVSWRPERRGAVAEASGAVSTLFPFALFEKSADIAGDVSLVVYPRPADADCPETGAEDGAPVEGDTAAGRPGPAIRGVREHIPADPVRDIHWKASARLGRWMVKEREKESASVAELRLEALAPLPEFERAVSRACALVLRWEREGRPYRLLLGDRLLAGPFDAGCRAKALSALALLSPDGRVPANAPDSRPAPSPRVFAPLSPGFVPSRRRGTSPDETLQASLARDFASSSLSFNWWLLRAHWAAGLLPLAFLPVVFRPAVLAAAASLAAGAILDGAGAPRRGWDRWAGPLLVVAACAAAANLLAGSRDVLSTFSLFVLAVQSVRFLLPKRARDGWQLCAVSYVEFLTSAASTSGMHFAAYLFLYLGLSAGAMWSLQAEAAAEAGEYPPVRIRARTAAGVLLLSAAACFLCSALLFAVTPRVGFGRMAHRLGRPAGLTGFSGTISLRDVTAVKADRSVVARVEFPALDPRLSPQTLYLRGATFTRFDGSRWTRGGAPHARVPRWGITHALAPPPANAALSTAEITLESMEHAAVFVYGVPISIEGTVGDLLTDGRGNYSFALSDSGEARYRLQFAGDGTGTTEALPAGGEYLELPEGWGDARDLAARLTAGAVSDREKARRIRGYLGQGFRYTLDDPASSAREFLFVRKAGYCEHFATGLCLLLRAAGIPARIAAGYLGGEWSTVGKYLIVRQSDAHAWTEAWIGGAWRTMDATPQLGENSPFFARTGMIGIYLDWARQRWNKYVVNYSLKMQGDAVMDGWSAARRARAWAARPDAWTPGGSLRRTAWGVAATGLAAGLLLLVRRRRAVSGSAAPPDPGGHPLLSRPYARLVRQLAARGHRRSPGTPLSDMVLSAAALRPELHAEAVRFLDLYHRDRFGPLPLSRAESLEAVRLAVRLRREAPSAR